METILGLVANAENVRTLVLLVFGFSGFVWLKTSMDRRIDELRSELMGEINSLRSELMGEINSLRSELYELRSTVEALIFVLEKNRTITKEDKEFVLSRGAGARLIVP